MPEICEIDLSSAIPAGEYTGVAEEFTSPTRPQTVKESYEYKCSLPMQMRTKPKPKAFTKNIKYQQKENERQTLQELETFKKR